MTVHVNVIQVYLNSANKKILVGRLAYQQRTIYFEYDSEFIKSGLQLSPYKLPLRSGAIACDDHIFEGLFGVFNDSLPDGWGRLLLDRKLMSLGIRYPELTPLDRLCYVGHRGMGALSYEPETELSSHHTHNDLDIISDEILEFQLNDNDIFIDDLLSLNGSSAGARPKILINNSIIKFRSANDPQDIGSIEYAYHNMAKNAGIDVPPAVLYPSKKCSGYFGVQRFDRDNISRHHMHTVSGLLHADHHTPSLDYETIMKATLWLTKNNHEGEKLFRQAVFNVLSHNRDDHAKNFSYLMDTEGVWHLSPAYDLTFSSGPAGEHCTTIMGEGKNPTKAHLLQLAAIGSIKEKNALIIIDEVKSAISKWKIFANEAGVSHKSSSFIQSFLNHDPAS